MTAPQPGPQRPDLERERRIQELGRRFSGFAVPEGPDKRFDPSNASPEALRQFGLPPRPDRERQGLLRAVWDEGFGRPLELRKFVFDADLVRDTEFRLFSRQVDTAPTSLTRFETSPNWAGGYLTANHFKRFLQIWGVWTVPGKLGPPKSTPVPGVPCLCSNWIGLDGQRRYFDSSLPQIGTESQLDLLTKQVQSRAWIQWWARDGINVGPVPLAFPISPGDRVLCVLTAWDELTVVGVIVNLSLTPVPVGMAIRGSPPVPQAGGPAHPVISGATAEWVLERPRNLNDTRLVNFPDYGTTRFEFCVAVENDPVDVSALATGTPQVLHGMRLIRMFDRLDGPARTLFTSMPRKLDDLTLEVRFGGF